MGGICGIAFSDQEQPWSDRQIVPMIRTLDSCEAGESFAVSGDSVAFGARGSSWLTARTSELTAGKWPIVAAFYGALYNSRELFPGGGVADLLAGILHLFQDQGIAFLNRLRGEFALAIWDGKAQSLYLATDRFRVHPIFYYFDEEKLVFGSRIKAILACPFELKLAVNPEAIVNVVGSSFIPTPQTIYREIYKLPPGHSLSYRNGAVKLEQYWDIDFNHADGRSEATLARELKNVFMDAVSTRLSEEADHNRVGAFLSGGVDSSTVTGVLTQLSRRPVKCFSIGFGERQFNEIHYARIAARAFSVQHYEYFVTPEDVFDAIPVLLESFDEPYANASAVPTYFCAKLARGHGIDVLYAGDGGDELFAGNERYAVQRLFDYYQAVPKVLRKYLVQPLVCAFANTLKLPFFVKGQKYIRRANVPYPERLFSYGFFNVISMEGFLNDGFLAAVGNGCDPYAAIRSSYLQARARSELDRQLYVDLHLTISDNDLFKVTRMTEAAGVGVRYPFLDHRLVDFAARVPDHLKMRGRELRTFFKRAYSDLLPQEVLAKQKHGFGLPIPVWLRTDRRLNDMMQDLVLSRTSLQRGYFRPQALRKLVKLHGSDQSSFYGTILWNLMILELWHLKSHRDAAAEFTI
jgi:asparagine synthase (glutamine-hydrolysing)